MIDENQLSNICEACGREPASMYKIKEDEPDSVKNCMALCERCKKLVNSGELSKSEMQYIHNSFMLGNRKRFLK